MTDEDVRRIAAGVTVTIGSLFSGIGGLELGLERAGLGPTIWQCEIDPWCRRVLARHWPDARRYEGVQEIDKGAPRVDLICGGFPCQDLSYAGTGRGLDGARSGLWFEYLRIVRALRPWIVVVENVPALLTRGLGVVLGGLAESGYDAQWDCIPAQAVGAPHRRDRVFVVAWRVSDTDRVSLRIEPRRRSGEGGPGEGEPRDVGANAEHSAGPRRTRRSDAHGCDLPQWPPGPHDMHAWGRLPVAAQPAICRVANGVPAGVDRRRLRSLGNAVVPQVAEVIGRAIVETLS